MPNVIIKVGTRAERFREIEEATDEWVWMRIYELRSVRLSPCFTVSLLRTGREFILSTPTASHAGKMTDPVNSLEHEMLAIWRRMGLDQDDYTAGAAVSFVRHLRALIKGRSQKMMIF